VGLDESLSEDNGSGLSASGLEPLPRDLFTGETVELRELGDYELLEQIGHGGMGVIYRAWQRSLDRIVAVKLIRGGALAKKEAVTRFRTEAAAAARLQHPGIVAIYEVGEHAGQQFYSMAYVAGHSLSAALREGPFLPENSARLLQSVAEAIQFAHQQGVLHRDLKPSNILLDSAGEAHVADFGLAKLLHTDSSLTLSDAVLGSPQYMPPEQATGKSAAVGVASDVYSLGAILYELLTGRPPFSAATPLETMKLVVEQEPIAPRALNPAIPRDLETICLKCLAKEPSARYASAAELAEELARYRRHEPIRARPVSLAERGWRWCRRKPALAGLGLVLAVAPLLVIGVLVVMRAKVGRERNRAQEQAEMLRLNLYAAEIQQASADFQNDQLQHSRQLLRAQRPGPGQPDLRGFEWRWLWAQTAGRNLMMLRGATNLGAYVVFAPNGGRLAAAGNDGSICIWETTSWHVLAQWALPTKEIRRLSFSADGRVLAISDRLRNVWLQDVETGTNLLSLEGVTAQGEPSVSALCFPQGTRVVTPWLGTNGERVARVFDWGERATKGVREVLRIEGGAFTEAFLPDGRLLLTISNQFGAYDFAQHSFTPLPGLGGASVEVSPDGRTLAGIDLEQMGAVFVRPLDRSEKTWLRSKSQGAATAVPSLLQFSPDGRLLFTGGQRGGAISFWNTASLEWEGKIPAFPSINHAAFSPDGHLLAISHSDGIVRLWPGRVQPNLALFTNANLPCLLSPDARFLAFARWRVPREATVAELDGFAVGDVTTGRCASVPSPGADAVPLFMSTNGSQLTFVVHVTNGVFELREFDLLRQTFAAGRQFLAGHDDRFQTAPVLFDAAGERVFATNVTQTAARGQRVARPRELTNGPLWFWRATRDGRLLGFSDSEGGLTVWDTATGAKLLELPPVEMLRTYWFFSEDGQQVCRSFQRGKLCFVDNWRIGEKRRMFELSLPAPARDLAYSSDGRSVAVIYNPAEVLVSESATGREIIRIPGQAIGDRLALSPDGKTIAIGGEYGKLDLFQTATGRMLASLSLPHDWPHDSIYLGVKPVVARWPRLVTFSPDNQTLLAADWGGWVRVWRAPSKAEIERQPD
jgi:WD40 repeat protein